MEIPDLLVVSKGDLGTLAERAASDLAAALGALSASDAGRSAPVLVTSAQLGSGIEDLIDAVERHRAALGDDAIAERRREGAARWALAAFRRDHGERGVETIGGNDAALDLARQALSANAGLLGAAHALEQKLAGNG
jgi:LAO/AO transport system kinase